MRNALLLVLATILCGTVTSARDYYIATDGSDDNPGTFERPFATLEKARDTIRGIKDQALASGSITVHIRGGKYFRARTFELAKRDSGLAAAPIVYRAYPGENVRLIGGHHINGKWFAPVADTDPESHYLAPTARCPRSSTTIAINSLNG
ncbi:MAG: hypothetical protein JSW27_23980 [Phycisphaerales bacterium]|nr:MAG: hypothetical protein JSW27_23980 [Phycisphaerales bacterium]